MQRQDGRQPFLLAVGFEDPHHPHCLPTEYQGRVRPEDVPLPAYTEGELEDKPPHFLEARQGVLEDSPMRGEFPVAGQGSRRGGYDVVTEAEARLGRAYYYSMVRLIDEQVGRILTALEQLGLAENTLVIFTTDHGELLGDHGLWMKGPFHYEELVRIPCIMRWPQGFAGGQRTEALFSQVDIVPTILAAVGLEQPQGLDGVNGLPLLRGEADSVRDAAMIECVDDPAKLRLKTLVTPDHKLTWYCRQPYGELYDLRADPGEKVNLWDDPASLGERARLLGRLLDEMESLEKRADRVCYA